MLHPQPLPVPGSRACTTPLHGSSDALALAQIARARRPLAVLTATAQDAQRLLEELPFFDPGLKVRLFPDWETLPYDQLSPHHDLVSERLATLYELTQRALDVALVPVTTALYRLAPADYLAARSFHFRQGARLAPEALRAQFVTAGYTHVTQVVAPGEYWVRGGLIDLFPTGSAVPYRIELDDELVASIRSFDVDTQRSIYKVNEVRLLPAREFPLDEEGQTRFRRNFRERFEGDPSRSRVYKDVSKGVPCAGIEYYLPLFFESTARITDYLPPETLLCVQPGLQHAIEQFWSDTHARYAMLRGDRASPVLPPNDLFLTTDEFFGAIKPYARIELRTVQGSTFNVQGSTFKDRDSNAQPATLDLEPGTLNLEPGTAAGAATAALPPLAVERRADDPLHRLRAFAAAFPGRVLVLAEGAGRRETMLEYFREYRLEPAPVEGYAQALARAERLLLAVGPPHAGFVLPDPALAVVTENELYAHQARPRRERDGARRVSAENMLRDLSEVKVGDPVVHEIHGVGRYQGLVTLDLGEGETEFLQLEYAGADRLYVPVSSLHLVGRYSGAPADAAPLHQLGSGQWEKARRKAARQVRDTAAELLELYAQRAARRGHAFNVTPHDFEAFCDDFPFEETHDQASAVNAVVEDLRSGKPMDRLICGDVGFGKTEVALRAAFVAVDDGKQVVVLVPTTLLAEQHFNTFSDRFAEWPVRIAELSRFRSGKETAEALSGLAEGRIDIAIGTHKLLSRDVKLKNLGLVIVDEEHRFGVRHKERLKALRAEVDVLTLTATPIPRTLAMALEGLRDFSVIATAPERRLAIKTFVARHSRALIREAALRELKRGGQIYYLHNDIDTIGQAEQMLAKLLPEARIRVAHGRIRERELEHVMRDFYQGRFNVLLCTTIIESGIDVPAANTIIIHRADKFGLAQLHQLRGRVGRSHHQAYAYLLLPDEGAITAQAKKRLDAIQMMEELGSGFFLAMHDLEIRGAGEVLGEAQSGEMHEVGFSLYCAMLDTAVRALKQGAEPDLAAPLGVTTEINLHVPALLPADYCGDVHERLVLYKRCANCGTPEELDALREELVDRFGLLPEPARTLLETHRLRILGKPLGIARIDATDSAIQLQFVKQPPIEPVKVLDLVQSRRNYRLAGQDRLRIELALPDVRARVAAIRKVFSELAPSG
ncbi:MAG: transcription-repair coupling factor [Betaproteobacteria bacterium]|nr:transcription-repair coupling factor [Betaproteobacteria bacterium]